MAPDTIARAQLLKINDKTINAEPASVLAIDAGRPIHIAIYRNALNVWAFDVKSAANGSWIPYL